MDSKQLNAHLGHEVNPATLPKAYYDFERYVSKERIISFWYQLSEALRCAPVSVLEVGVGPRVVNAALQAEGISVTSVDINPSLVPDVVARVQDLTQHFETGSFDLVLCARVLHHVPFAEFDRCLREMSTVTKQYVILTVPVDELRLYVSFKLTAMAPKLLSIRLPLALKRSVLRLAGQLDSYYSRLWKVNSSRETGLREIEAVLAKYFEIERSYSIPENRSHRVFVLAKRLQSKPGAA